ncbi:glycosyltransferase [Arthrobacter sp. NEB 688]|uniref:glycosyltransferase n=1 Tax=Arthrobacter sp. NEB 688 TaxID=904039 RepID=UPI001564EB01|nr:glycosyltransferase [Arthrobacter sp. NEB 688]QKE85632.1 hypothetical protein HL663_18025 [Arthrobacter sp. NEB 688]
MLRAFPRGVRSKLVALPRTELQNLRRLWRSDVLVVHTALSLSLVAIVAARLLKRPVVAFVWDIYPASTRIAGNIRNPVLLRMYDVMERAATRSATRLLVPSEDYLPFLPRAARSRALLYPLWPTGPMTGETSVRDWPVPVLSVAFAGQINGIRGLDGAVRQTLESAPEGVGVQLHIYSKDPTPDVLEQMAESDRRLSVVHHGFMGARELETELTTHHLGLVTLDPAFDLPAFPSKIAAYLSAGLPVLYVGRRMPALERVLTEAGIGGVASSGGLTIASLAQLFERYPVARRAHLRALDEQWSHVDRLL